MVLKARNFIKIGTRASALAVYQAEQVKKFLLASDPNLKEENIKIVTITTTGDKFLTENISEIGGKVLFTKEIEEALLNKLIDIAVHSVKDIPATLPKGLKIAGYLPREEEGDALISKNYNSLAELPRDAIIGTSALRRKASILRNFSHLNVVSYRGNINSRIKRMTENNIDAIILATSGVKRIGKESLIKERISKDIMLPAVGQGAIGIQIREDDPALSELIQEINCEDTKLCVEIERRFMFEIDGSCKTPFGCFVKKIDDENVQIKLQIIHPDGSEEYRLEKKCKLNEVEKNISKMSSSLKNKAHNIFQFIN